MCSAISRTACDFYSRVNNSKKDCCVYCIQKGIETKFTCVYKPMSDWCVSFDETIPLIYAGDSSWYKIHLYECSFL